tara:strand:- start:319 stop:1089 length:771 start_codon:yes stop_codon:yes gene_type:complete
VRFTFTQKFGARPSSEDYNTVKDDFLDYINTSKLTKDNVGDESIRFRHLKQSPTVMLFKDCGNAIWSAGAAISSIGLVGAWELYKDAVVNTLQLVYSVNSDAPGTDLVEFTLWYYPYSFSYLSEVAPAIKVSGTWTPMIEHARPAGVGVGFYTEYEQLPYSLSHIPRVHPMLQYSPSITFGSGQIDRLGTVGYGGPIVCTVTMKKSELADVEAFGMMVKHNLDHDTLIPASEGIAKKESKCSVYDRLYLSLVARDN